MNGRLRVYVTGGLQRSTDRAVIRQALSPALPKKKSSLKLKPSGAPLVAEREIKYKQLIGQLRAVQLVWRARIDDGALMNCEGLGWLL